MASQQQEVLNRVQQRTAELIKFAADNFKLQLDYTEASIPRVEHALGEIHKHMGAKAEQNKAAIVNLSNGFGSYLGEVLRRKHGGAWRVNLPNFPPGVEGLDINGTILAPLQQVFLRITKGAQYSIEDFYSKAAAVIAKNRSTAASRPTKQACAADPAGGMREYAAKAVAEAKERFGIDLDYTEASLDRLDQVLVALHDLLTDNVPESKRLHPDEKFILKPVAAAKYVGYLSEVFCRVLGAEWRNDTPGCPPDASRLTIGGKLLEVALRGETISPPQVIVNCINDPEHWSIKNYYLDVKRTYQVDAAMKHAASFDDQMAVCAQEAVTIARDRYGRTLDFSESSVTELENLLAVMHTSLPKPGDPARPSDEWIASIAVTFGAYLGEIFRKNLGGKWLQQNPKATGSLPCLNVQGNVLTPCRKVSKRILEGPVEDVAFFYRAACQIIREGPSSLREQS
jgi:hypothetical protein